MAFLSKKWFDSLPKDLQTISIRTRAKPRPRSTPGRPISTAKRRKIWAQNGEIISLPANEQAEMMKTLETVGQDVAKRKPEPQQAYNVFAAVAKRTK